MNDREKIKQQYRMHCLAREAYHAILRLLALPYHTQIYQEKSVLEVAQH